MPQLIEGRARISELWPGQYFRYRGHWYVMGHVRTAWKDCGLGGYTKQVGFSASTRVHALASLSLARRAT